MPVEPGVVDLFFVDLSRGKIGLGILAVDHVSVHVDVVKFIVLPYTLCLIVERLYRLVIVDSDVFDRLRIVCNILAGQLVVCSKGFYRYVLKLISVLGVFDISLQIFLFFIDFVRRNDEVLYQIAGACTYQAYDDHNHRHSENLLKLLLADVVYHSNRSDQGQHDENPVHPQRHVHVGKARAVNRARMGMEQIELLQEKVDRDHHKEDHAEERKLPRSDVHELAEVVVVKVFLRLWLRLRLLSAKGFKDLFERIVAAHTFKRIAAAVAFFVGITGILLLFKDIRAVHGQQDDVVDYRNHDNHQHYADQHLVELLQKI